MLASILGKTRMAKSPGVIDYQSVTFEEEKW